MSIENDLTRIADGIDRWEVILGSEAVISPLDDLSEERLEAAEAVRQEVLVKEIPKPTTPPAAEIEAETTKAQPAVTVLSDENKKLQTEIKVGDYVRVITGAKKGLKGTIPGGEKAWLKLTIDEGIEGFRAGTVASVRRGEILPTIQNGETPTWVEAAKAVEGVELTEETEKEVADPTPEAPEVIPAAQDFVPSVDLSAPENFALPGTGKHSGKTLNTIFNEGNRGINYLKWIASNSIMEPEVTTTIQAFLKLRNIEWE